MASNDVIILNQILSQKNKELAPDLDEHEYFEIFTAEQILKDYELTYEEIQSGITGSGGDGGIDSIYVFANGDLLQEDTDYSGLKKNITIDLVIIQSKTSAKFSEATIDKFTDVTENLLDLSIPIKKFETVYNKELRSIIERFRNAYEELASKFPKLRVSYYYATKGSEINHTLIKKVEKLKSKVNQLFSSSECMFTFLGASELLTMARRSPKTTYSLNLVENPISSSGKGGFVCVVSLNDYYKFITDEKGNLIKNIFEANVRDYQGNVLVNEQIQHSLRDPHSEDFWWLNNGVTILAGKATLSGKMLTIESPEIVNGLQTSAEIHKYYTETNPPSEARNLLIRVVVPQEPTSRDRIIKATNSQTAISPASLRATEKIHRDIEEFLKPYGLYYDRRKNFYKNEGKPIERIISISYMAQSLMSVVLQRPDDARARPSSLLNKDEDYTSLFSTEHPIKIYYFCIALMQRVEKCVREYGSLIDLDRKTRGDIKFHVAMYASILAANKLHPTIEELSELSARDIDEYIFDESVKRVMFIYNSMTDANPGESNKVAKSPEFKAAVLNDASANFMPASDSIPPETLPS